MGIHYIICFHTANFGCKVHYGSFNCGYIGKIGILGTFFGILAYH